MIYLKQFKFTLSYTIIVKDLEKILEYAFCANMSVNSCISIFGSFYFIFV